MRKILITGGAGFIGLNLLNNFSSKFDVTVFDNFSRGKMDNAFRREIKKKNIKFVKVDLKKKILKRNNFDYIFHLAATVGVKNVIQNPIETIDNN